MNVRPFYGTIILGNNINRAVVETTDNVKTGTEQGRVQLGSAAAGRL